MKILITLLMAIAVNSFAQNSDQCSAPEAKQFDFWIGEWNLSWTNQKGETETGTNIINKIMGGCVVQENFSNSDGSFIGTSVSVYNPAKAKWLQTWVDNEGSYLDFTGNYGDGKMMLSRDAKDKDSNPVIQRMVFYNITGNEFDWDWEKSVDAGSNWTTLWKIHYKRKT